MMQQMLEEPGPKLKLILTSECAATAVNIIAIVAQTEMYFILNIRKTVRYFAIFLAVNN